MLIGHSPQSFINESNINSTCKDKLWRIDVGCSRAFNSSEKKPCDKYRKPQVLEIT